MRNGTAESRLSGVRLGLLLTLGSSLSAWQKAGILERELAVFTAMAPALKEVQLVSYGSRDHRIRFDRPQNVGIVQNRLHLPLGAYVRWLLAIRAQAWQGPTVLRSNQVLGADLGLQMASRHGMPFVARCGYLPSTKKLWKFGRDSKHAQDAMQMEARVFEGADRVVVTTDDMRETITDRYGVRHEKIRVIPNYVDTDRFRPGKPKPPSSRLCYVGRLEEVKNVRALVESVRGLDVTLDIVGGGSLEPELKTVAERDELPITFHGFISNAAVADVLRTADLFILPSHFEHHPKAMIEAMAAGLPVLGTDVPGIRGLIQPGETGFLTETSPDALRQGIAEAIHDGTSLAEMGRAAREYAVHHFSLERVVYMELDLLSELAS